MSQVAQQSPDPEQIRAHLRRILASPAFSGSERMCRFLRFIVEKYLSGRGAELKEYTLGTEVFDRDASFDPRIDPIVRVEARRLRAKLRQYYLAEGSNEPLTIDLPKGSYVPVIATGPATEAAPTDRVVAVLPFTTPGGDEQTQYLGDGLTQQIIHRLTRMPGLRVVGWHSASRMRDLDPVAAARELQATSALTGSIRTGGDRLRIGVQLIEAPSGAFLWSEFYDRPRRDLFAIEEDIADAVSSALAAKFGITPEMPPCPVAYEHYFRGVYNLNRRTPDALRRAADCFGAAIECDETFPLAWAALASARILLTDYGVAGPREAMEAARAAARRALELSPHLGEAEAALGMVRGLYDWDWSASERHFRRAMDLSPGYATTFHWYALDHCALRGQMAEATEALEVALRLDPLSSIIREGRGYLCLMDRRYDAAVEEHRRLIEFDPSFYKAWASLGRAWIQLGAYDTALACFGKATALGGATLPNLLAAQGQAHALAGNRDRAEEILGQLRAIADTGYVSHTCFATVYLGLGDHQAAVESLERGMERRDLSMSAIGAHPLYDPLRGLPGFQSLVERMGLPAR